MNVQLPGKPEGYKRRIIMYILILTLCICAVGIAIYQLFAGEKLGVIVGITKSESEEIEELKSKFNTIFNNNIELSSADEENSDTEIVYTVYKEQEKSSNNYDLNVNIPYININNNLAQKYNEEIKESFEQPAKFILTTQSRNISYSVSYIADVQENVLSLAILSTFKEGNSAQRTLLKTYNYDLSNNTEVTLEKMLELNSIEKNKAQNIIDTEINKSQKQIEELRKMGYEIYSRNTNDQMYKIENTEEYFIYKNHIYLAYAYGNNNNTSEMDIVII